MSVLYAVTPAAVQVEKPALDPKLGLVKLDVLPVTPEVTQLVSMFSMDCADSLQFRNAST
jgi:hypothetical protein